MQCYSRLHLFTDIVSNASEKADKKGQLNAFENGEFSSQAGTRREISGLEMENLSKVLLCLLIYSG